MAVCKYDKECKTDAICTVERCTQTNGKHDPDGPCSEHDHCNDGYCSDVSFDGIADAFKCEPEKNKLDACSIDEECKPGAKCTAGKCTGTETDGKHDPDGPCSRHDHCHNGWCLNQQKCQQTKDGM